MSKMKDLSIMIHNITDPIHKRLLLVQKGLVMTERNSNKVLSDFDKRLSLIEKYLNSSKPTIVKGEDH